MANSKFDMSLLEPIQEENQVSTGNFNQSLLVPEEQQNENRFLPPKQEGIIEWLPRDIMIGLLNQRQNMVNTPYELVKNLENQGQQFGQSINQTLPLEKYTKGNRLPFSPIEKAKPISEYLPHEQNDFAKLLGQKGTPSTGSWLIQKGIEHAPEIFGTASLFRNLPLTARGIVNRMSAHKQHEISHARTQYRNLFNEAENQGIRYVIPPDSVMQNRHRIAANSQAKHNRALNEYIQYPSLENAHFAQSELGALERHLEKIADKNGLTPTQNRTLRAVQQTRNDIRQEMMSENGLGINPELAQNYQNITNEYREHVVPYTRLKPLTESENQTKLPKSAIKDLLNDDQFMIELARRYPGLMLHTPKAKKILGTILGTGATIGGYEGIKKLLK